MLELGLLAALLMGHILGDFYFQPASWVNCRNRDHYLAKELYFHAAVHGILSLIVFTIFSKHGVDVSLWYSAIILLSHFFIDVVKSYVKQTPKHFFIDQVAHLLVLFLVWGLMTGQLAKVISLMAISHISYQQLTIFTGYLMVLKPTSIMIAMLLKPWTMTIKAGQPDENDKPNGELQSAGKRIGYLERLLILTFILLNQFTAIGFLLAAKSVFRFGDLSQDKDKKLTEYVMLGTLTSFTISIFIGLAVTAIASQLPIGK